MTGRAVYSLDQLCDPVRNKSVIITCHQEVVKQRHEQGTNGERKSGIKSGLRSILARRISG